MQKCMTQYPALYANKDSNLEDYEDDMEEDMQDEKKPQGGSKVSSTKDRIESKREERPEASSTNKTELERTNVN